MLTVPPLDSPLPYRYSPPCPSRYGVPVNDVIVELSALASPRAIFTAPKVSVSTTGTPPGIMGDLVISSLPKSSRFGESIVRWEVTYIIPFRSSSSVSSSSSYSQQLSSSAQNPLRISNPGSSQTSDTPLPSDVPSGPSPTDTKPPHVQTSDPVTSPDVVSSSLSQPSLPNPPLTGSIDHNGPFTTSTQPDAKSTGVPADSTSQGYDGIHLLWHEAYPVA